MGLYGKSRSPGWIRGDHWIYCQRCGFTLRSSKGKREWTRLIVCPRCWDPRHPQEFLRARKEDIAAKGLVTGEPKTRDVAPAYTENTTNISNTSVPGATHGDEDLTDEQKSI